jgi:hypothetical protein
MKSERICELGAGQSGLIGFSLAALNDLSNLEIIISDGNA